MSRLQRLLFAAILPLSFTPLATTAARAEAPRIEIRGTEAPRADSDRVGDATVDAIPSVAVTLPLRNSTELDRVIASVSDPASPQYGRYLSQADFIQQFAPTSEQVGTVVDQLRSSGLTVTHESSNHQVIDAAGSTAQLSRAFGTSIGRYHDRRTGREYVANDNRVALPPTIAANVVGVVGLDNHYPAHPHLSQPGVGPHVGGGPGGGYTPAQLRQAYDIGPLANAGFSGQGQNIGLLELDGFVQSNITFFDNHYGLASPAPTVRQVDGGSGPLGSGQSEVELDIEILHAFAPAAAVTVWEGPNTGSGIIDIYNAMVTANITPTNSTSWGLCEGQSSLSFATAESNIFKQAAATGMGFFASSGDNGAYDCGGPLASLGVDDPASDPYLTAVGGTTLSLTASGTYGSEAAWRGSGGGLSSYFSRPSWQAGPGVANGYSDGKRQVPDVATDADPNAGYSIYTKGSWGQWGGTSASAPSWAAFAALYNQDAIKSGKPRLGFANPALYQLASQPQQAPPLHDVTSGNNQFYSATTGWDYPTGLGTYDAYNIARDLISQNPASQLPTVAVLPAMTNGAYGGYVTSLTVQNAGTAPATVRIAYFDVNGASVGIGDSVGSLAVNAGWTVRQDNGNSFPSTGGNAVQAGSAIVYSSQPITSFVNEFAPGNVGDATSYTGIPVPSGEGSTLYAPSIANNAYGGYTTGIGLLNHGTSAADVTVIYRDASGTVVRTQRVSGLASQAYTALYSGDSALALPKGFAGTATISNPGGQPLAAVINETGPGGQFTSYDAAAGGSALLNAPVALNNAYGGYNTGMGIQNTSATGGSVAVTYYDAVGTATPKSFAIAGNGYLGVYQGSSTGGPAPGAYTAVIQSSTVPLAAVVNEVAPAGAGSARQATSYNAVADGSGTVRLALVENGGPDPWNTGEGIMNTGAADTTVTVSYYDAAGAAIGTPQTMTLAPEAFWGLDQPSGGLATGVRGTAVVTTTAGGRVAVICNESGPNTFMSYQGQ